MVRPATKTRFDDVAIMLGPKNPESSVCWCLSHRLDWKTNRALTGPARGEYVRKLCGRKVAPGVLAYCDGEVAGLGRGRAEVGTAVCPVCQDPARRRAARVDGVVHPRPSRLPRPGHLACAA